MSSISSYLTASNVAYAATAAGATLCLVDHMLEYCPTRDFLRSWGLECTGALSLAGIAAIVIKERSFQSAKLATLFTVGLFAVGCWNQDGVFKRKVKNGLVGATFSMWGYAVVSLIIATGTKMAPYLRKH